MISISLLPSDWFSLKDFASPLSHSFPGPVSRYQFRVPYSGPEFGPETKRTNSEFTWGRGHIVGQNVGPYWGMVFWPAQRLQILGQKTVPIWRASVSHQKNFTRLMFAAWLLMQKVVLVLVCVIVAVCVFMRKCQTCWPVEIAFVCYCDTGI